MDRQPQANRSPTTATCGTAITQAATLAARSGPRVTGSEFTPVARSPSSALKSFSVMMPWAPRA
jgi:hypothetical protein